MIRKLNKALRRFRRNEDGSAIVIEFVVFTPMIISAFVMAVELGVYSMHHMFLDRGLDLTVRHVRLNTNTPMTHADLKDRICTYAGFLDDCETTLRLEMQPINPRAFAEFPQQADCIDLSEEVTPVRGFELGREHQLMILRACVKFKPVFPTTGIGFQAEKDGSGRLRMVSSAAFVQEPN